MKKLMVLVAIVAMSIAASATNVKWGITSGQALTDANVASGTIYLIYGAIPETSTWATMASFSEASIESAGGAIWASGTVADGAFYNATGEAITPATTGIAAGAGKSVYTAIISDDGKYIAVTDTAKTMNLQDSALSAVLAWAPSSYTTYTAVPEPTSGVLILIGASLLALRRKQK